MNKQQALEAVLAMVRMYEEPNSERPRVPHLEALRELGAHCERVARMVARNNAVPSSLICEMAALCVHLLRDEYEPVVAAPAHPVPPQEAGTAERIRQTRERGERT